MSNEMIYYTKEEFSNNRKKILKEKWTIEELESWIGKNFNHDKYNINVTINDNNVPIAINIHSKKLFITDNL